MSQRSRWTRLTGEVAYENAWIRVDADQVIRPDGSEGVYGVVTLRNDAVFVIALTDTDDVLMLKVDRYTVGESWEVPAGGADGDEPLVAAQRELLEETGFVAAQWDSIGQMNALNGICRAPEHVFLARGLTKQSRSEHEQQLEGIADVVPVPWAEVMTWIRNGQITDGESVAALMYAALHLGKVS